MHLFKGRKEKKLADNPLYADNTNNSPLFAQPPAQTQSQPNQTEPQTQSLSKPQKATSDKKSSSVCTWMTSSDWPRQKKKGWDKEDLDGLTFDRNEFKQDFRTFDDNDGIDKTGVVTVVERADIRFNVHVFEFEGRFARSQTGWVWLLQLPSWLVCVFRYNHMPHLSPQRRLQPLLPPW